MNQQRLSNKDILDRYLSKKRVVPETSTKVKEPPSTSSSLSYAVIRNIPKEMRSKDLRKYFKGFVENNKIHCFHYRHRPELQGEQDKDAVKKSTCCCVVSFRSFEDREEFIKEFHKSNWQDTNGMEIPRRCFVDRMKVRKESEAGSSTAISESDLAEMIELKPPAVMPNGNVGTPSEYFLEQIRLCKMPASLIPKLWIQTSRRKRKFGEVFFEYDGTTIEEVDGSEKDESSSSNKFRVQQDSEVSSPKRNDKNEESESDDDQCEEWERHEALHDDVTEQDRTKPRKYEEEMEVTWEKGGPGLVWHTDKNYWDEREKGTDCDWAWADDWDVDYSVYYEGKSAGDLDARDGVEIQQDQLMRSGKMEQSVFTRKLDAKRKTRKRRNSDETDLKSSNVRDGVGGKLLKRLGWKEGSGLGKLEQGKIVPVAVDVEEEGQSGSERRGFGYRGEKMSRFVTKTKEQHIIASVFDKVSDREGTSETKTLKTSDCGETILRSSEPTKMKYFNI